MLKKQSWLLVVVLVIFTSTVPVWASVIKVGTAPWGDYSTVQEAVNATVAGDEIWVMEGEYLLSQEILIAKAISIFGGFQGTESTLAERDWQDHTTVIDGDHAVRCFSITETVLIDGFTVKNGYNQGSGAGIYIMDAAPIIRNCQFEANRADATGGAVYNSGFNCEASPEISGCIFNGNKAVHKGGAIYNAYSAPLISGCKFTSNSTTNTDMGSGDSSGGAIYVDTRSAPEIIGCTFANNSVNIYGGAIYCNGWAASAATLIKNCVFTQNTADYCGGALFAVHFTGIVSNGVFNSNSALLNGGGIENYDPDDTVIVNCTLWNNSAGSGPGIYDSDASDVTLTIANTIVWNNSSSGQVIVNNYGAPLVTHSNIKGSGSSSSWDDTYGLDGGGNIDEVPLFFATDDLHLQAGSPGIDAGDNTLDDLPDTDLDGQERILDGDGNGVAVVDMGAYEFTSKTCEYDLDRDGDVDGEDLSLFAVQLADLKSFAIEFGRIDCQ